MKMPGYAISRVLPGFPDTASIANEPQGAHEGFRSLARRDFGAERKPPVHAHWTLAPATGYPLNRHVVLEGILEGGADRRDVGRAGARAEHEVAIEWTLTIRTAAGAVVRVIDRQGRDVCSDRADEEGEVTVVAAEWALRPPGETTHTPHLVELSRGGETVLREVTVDRTVDLEPSRENDHAAVAIPDGDPCRVPAVAVALSSRG